MSNSKQLKLTGNKQNDVINHVGMQNVVEKRWQWFYCMVANVLKLWNQLLSKFVINNCHIQWRSFIGEEVAIIGRLQVKLQIIQRFALNQIEVVCLFDDAALEATDEAFQVAIVDVEDTFEIHVG